MYQPDNFQASGSSKNRNEGRSGQQVDQPYQGYQQEQAISQDYQTGSKISSSQHYLSSSQLGGPPDKAPVTEKVAERTRLELEKLLSVALQRLRDRERPPSVFEMPLEVTGHGISLHTTSNVVRGAIRMANAGSEWNSDTSRAAEDADDLDEGPVAAFSTEQTFRHLTVVRDSLILHGRKIFSTNIVGQKDVGQLLSVKSEGEKAATSVKNLADDLISLLSEIVLEDCRYKITRIRLVSPPNALQGVVLEVASILARLHRQNPQVLSQLGFALLPSLSTFDTRLHERIMRFFEVELLKPMLVSFSQSRGTRKDAVNLENVQVKSSAVPEIQVEQATEDASRDEFQLFQPWITDKDQNIGAPSWTAPRQSSSSYDLAALVSPLLAFIFSIVEFHNGDLETLYRLHSLISTVIELKEDAYADIMDVVAFHSPASRRAAINTLSTFWPKSFGHVMLTKSLSVMSYQDCLLRLNAIQPSRYPLDPYAHEFMLWRFDAPPPTPSIAEAIPTPRSCTICTVCSKVISGLGLYCPFCTCAIHLDTGCYDHPEGMHQLTYKSQDGNVQKISQIRFSDVLTERRSVDNPPMRKERHVLEPVHLFCTVLCYICYLPLWGCYRQGYKCSSCRCFFHSTCVEKESDVPACRSIPFSWKHVTIRWDKLRKSWIDHYRSLIWNEEELFNHSYEEVSIAYGIFWMEAELLAAGLSNGSIVVEQNSSRSVSSQSNPKPVDHFELHHFVALYRAQLVGTRLQKSPQTYEFIDNCGPLKPETSFLHDLPLLALAATIIKLPPASVSKDDVYLRVNKDNDSENDDKPPHPYEIVSLAHIRDALGNEMNIYSNTVARILLRHLHRLGVFARLDGGADAFLPNDPPPLDVICSFPETLAIDASTSVEALFAAIEACLQDMDISINEFGFILLTRRCWPTGLMTDYALSRLASLVLSWILTEDDRLLLVVRDYISMRKPLPGVRLRSEKLPWPESSASRGIEASSGISTAEYTTTRRAIINRYALPWLLRVHELNPILYAECLYQRCLHLSEVPLSSSQMFLEQPERALSTKSRRDVEIADETLRYIVKLCTTGVVWTSFDTLFVKLLDTMSQLTQISGPAVFKNLPRLFMAEDPVTSRRSAFSPDENAGIDLSTYMLDPWRVIVDSASEDVPGLERCLQWVLVLARSGVEIPTMTLLQLAAFARDFSAPFITHTILVEAILYSIWVKSFGRQEVLALIASLYGRHFNSIKDGIAKKENLESIHSFLRHSLMTCLLLYGCKREVLRSLNLLDPSQLLVLPPRRRSNVPVTANSTDPLSIDMDMLDILSLAAMEGSEETCLIVAKFLNALVTESSLLSSEEVDQFVLINGHTLNKCAWHFYSQTQIPELIGIRSGFLLRLLVVDIKPFENILLESLHASSPWEIRFEAITRLFRIILDLNAPNINIEGRAWRSSIVPLFVHFFSQSWKDERAEIRLTCETLARTLLPIHLEAMSNCFEEYFVNSTIPQCISLTMFLISLHPMLPTWRLVSWISLGHALGRAKNLAVDADSAKPEDSHSDNDEMMILQAALLNLGFQMIADGVTADLASLLVLKRRLVEVLGFQRCVTSPSRNTFRVTFDGITTISSNLVVQSCLQGLMRVLDTSASCELPPACMIETLEDITVPATLGSVYVDVILALFLQLDLPTVPYLVSRNLLTSLVIILSKHDFESALLNHLSQMAYKAVYAAMQLLTQPSLSFDIKQMVFGVGQAAIIHFRFEKQATTLSDFVSLTTALLSEYGVSSDHMLSARGRQFIDEILSQFSNNRIYWTLFKNHRSPEFFTCLSQILRERAKSNEAATANQQGDNVRDAVVREILAISRDRKPSDELDTALKNLATYVETVHHQGYSESLISFLGTSLGIIASQITGQAGDWRPGSFDPNPLLKVCGMVAQHHKMQGKDLMLQGGIYLRAVLSRFVVEREVVSQIIHISASLLRRHSRMGSEMTVNHVLRAVLEATDGMVKRRIKGQAITTANLLEILCQSVMLKDDLFPTEAVLSIVPDGVQYLHDHIPDNSYVDSDFASCIALAKLMMLATNIDSQFIYTITGQETGVSIRMWNFLILAVTSMDRSECALSLWKTVTRFTQSYQKSLQYLLSSPQMAQMEGALLEINHVFISIRLWLLLIQQICSKSSLSTVVGHLMDRDHCDRLLWNEVWPSIERLLLFSVSVAGVSELQTFVTLTWQSFASIVLFLNQSRSVIALECSFEPFLIQIKDFRVGDSLSNKITRALKAQIEPPTEVSLSSQIEYIQKDFLAVEKFGWSIRRRNEEPGREERDVRRHGRQATVT